jgi:hypothetical protein
MIFRRLEAGLLPAAVVLVCGATLWPFDFSAPRAGSSSAALLVGWGFSTELDVVRNILGFLALGIAFARFPAAPQRPLRACLAGFCCALPFAYGLEVLQGFTASRFPSIVDVVANTLGATAGVALGVRHYRATWIRPLVYVATICVLAVPLHQATRLDTWSRSFPLVIGNEADGNRPWQGVIHELCFSARALSASAFAKAAPGASCNVIDEAERAGTYRNGGPDRLEDPTGTLPALYRKRGWFTSPAAGAALSERFTESSAFSVFTVFEPGSPEQRGPARIVSLSADADRRNFTLGQDAADLVVRLRTRATNTNGTARVLYARGVLTSPGRHSALFTYDGSTQCLTVDAGRPACMRLTPGIAAAAALDLKLAGVGPVWAWDTAYYAALFIPLGALVARRRSAGMAAAALWLIAGSSALEFISAAVPGRAFRVDALAEGTAWGTLGVLITLMWGMWPDAALRVAACGRDAPSREHQLLTDHVLAD